MSSEWLQGPHLYALLHDERGLSEQTVASLYATTFVAAAVSAMFTGFLADRFGRRSACFAFCLVHSTASLTVISSSLPVLVLGRVLAGIALTLLWTVFESWMVTEFNARALESSTTSLSSMFRLMTTSNCLAAIFGGLLSHCIVLALGSRTTPFLVGIVFEFGAAILMMRNWNENLGTTAHRASEEIVSSGPHDQSEPARSFGDFRLWLLSFVSCFFEGTNFLILFFWAGMLQEAHQVSSSESRIPYGVIFATFMAAMVIGALLFGVLVSNPDTEAPNDKGSSFKLRGTVASHWLLSGAILVAAADLVVLALVDSEIGIFIAFLVFEFCNGVYIPTIAYQRGVIVDEGSRTFVYGLMKIPLFIFVIGSLNMTGADGHRRQTAILLAAGSLFLAAISSTMLRTSQSKPSYVPVGVHESKDCDVSLATASSQDERRSVEQSACPKLSA